MKASEASALLDPVLADLKRAVGLHEWEIRYDFESLRGGAMGDCETKRRYMTAHIRIDPLQHESFSELVRTVNHEHLHILHSPFEEARAVAMLFAGDERESAAVAEAFDAAAEYTVFSIETMLRCLGYSVNGLLREREPMSLCQPAKDPSDSNEDD